MHQALFLGGGAWGRGYFEGEHLTEFYGASLLSCSRVLLGALYSFELEGTVGAPQSVKVLCEEWVLFVFDLLTK